MKGVAISIFLDKRRKKDNGLYPVKLRVYLQKEVRLYGVNVELTEEDFTKAYVNPKPRKEDKEVRIKLTAIENKANDVVKGMSVFTFEAFEKKMFRATGDRNNVIYHYQQYIQALRDEKKISTAINYQQSLNSLLSFLADGKSKTPTHLPFEHITLAFLNQYENWMTGKGKQLTTVGIYLRPLRAIFNSAITEGDIDRDIYPFNKRKYQIPAGRNIKKALDKEALKSLFQYSVPAGSAQEKARAFWFLSYQCNGMNIRDIAELKGKNLQDQSMIFTRRKTRNTTKADSKPIVVPITQFIRQTIDKYGKYSVDADDYVFPILNKKMTETEKLVAVQNFTRFINQHIKLLAKDAGVSGGISTYWARHSFTTMAIRNGASMEYIQESLGHNDMKTTMNYWGGFEENVKREITDKLMDF